MFDITSKPWMSPKYQIIPKQVAHKGSWWYNNLSIIDSQTMTFCGSGWVSCEAFRFTSEKETFGWQAKCLSEIKDRDIIWFSYGPIIAILDAIYHQLVLQQCNPTFIFPKKMLSLTLAIIFIGQTDHFASKVVVFLPLSVMHCALSHLNKRSNIAITKE